VTTQQHPTHKSESGFTLIELLIVIAIIGILYRIIGNPKERILATKVNQVINYMNRGLKVSIDPKNSKVHSSITKVIGDVFIVVPNMIDHTEKQYGVKLKRA
tara:strand:- start:216 stop:521 length:306 start_codon:yes stop_codon:yes gene_type:complete